MRRLSVVLSCVLLLGVSCGLLLLVNACAPKSPYSGDVPTARVTDHGAPADRPEVAPQVPERATEDVQDIVHATRTGKRYHRAGCRHLAKSDIPMSRADAEAKGLTPCGTCKP